MMAAVASESLCKGTGANYPGEKKPPCRGPTKAAENRQNQSPAELGSLTPAKV